MHIKRYERQNHPFIKYLQNVSDVSDTGFHRELLLNKKGVKRPSLDLVMLNLPCDIKGIADPYESQLLI